MKSNTVRQLVDFNNGWDFYLETLKSKNKSKFTPNNFKKIKEKKSVNLPHDWSIEQHFTKKYHTENESASLPGGIGWYTKTLSENEMSKYLGKNVNLVFDGVYLRSYIFVNGKEVASNLYGYNSFEVDISAYFTHIQKIEIAVLVINQLPNSRWYSGSGIYRKVFLRVTNPVYIKPNSVYVSTPDLKTQHKGVVSVRVESEVVNTTPHSQKLKIKNEIINRKEETVASVCTEEFLLPSGESALKILYPKVENAELWSIDNPVLYTLRTTLYSDEVEVDCSDTDFGFRWFDYDLEKGLHLNGEPVKIKGVCLHHDQGALGACAYTDALLRQLEIMKNMGANAIRTAHNPACEDLIKICNRIGLLVVEEAFDTWEGKKNKYDFSTLFKKELKGTNLNLVGAEKGVTWDEFVIRSMVMRDRNAPCIMMWSLGNEIQGNNSRKNSSRLSFFVEKVDPYHLGGRKKIYAEDDLREGLNDQWADVLNGFSQNDGIGKDITVAGVNYVDAETFEQAHKDYPNILMLSTESSSALRSRDEYFHPCVIKDDYNTDTKATADSQMSSYDNEVASWANTAMFDWQYDISLDYVLGEFVWTGFDYLGEPTPFTDNSSSFYPTSSYFGITDTAGFEKDIYYFYQSQWKTPEETAVLHLLPHWNLTENQLDNGNALVVCYTNACSVELRAKKNVDDEDYVSFGVKKFKKQKSSAGLRNYCVNEDDSALYKMSFEWEVPYEKYKDYILFAVALNFDNSVDERFNNSSGRKMLRKHLVPSKLRLSPYSYKNDFRISDDGYKLHYISVEILDENDTLCTDFNEIIEFSVSGDAQIIGVDNGNSSDTNESKYADKNSIKAFHGKALVILKSKQISNFVIYAETNALKSQLEIK